MQRGSVLKGRAFLLWFTGTQPRPACREWIICRGVEPRFESVPVAGVPVGIPKGVGSYHWNQGTHLVEPSLVIFAEC